MVDTIEDNHRGFSRRGFVAGAAAVGGVAASGLVVGRTGQAVADEPGDDPRIPDRVPDSTFFGTVFVAESASLPTASDGDLWPCCWADDDYVYAANGDGRGFSSTPLPHQDIVLSRIAGTPASGLTGAALAASAELADVWGDPKAYNRKPTGMLCVNGVLYLAMQDLKYGAKAFDDAPNASISRSDDHGRTWKKTSTAMFTDYQFTTIMFLDFGKNSRHARPALGARDGSYVYAYGLDWNWRRSNACTVPNPVDLYLARVPAAAVQDRRAWEFFAGMRGRTPRWTQDINHKVAVLHDETIRYESIGHGIDPSKGNQRVVAQGGVFYNAPLRRYIYTSWNGYGFEFYDSPTPWGPWSRFDYHNFGPAWVPRGEPNTTPKQGGYGTVVPTKFISADGRDLWINSNWAAPNVTADRSNYNFCLRKVRLTPRSSARPTNRPDSTNNLARTGADVTTIGRCAHKGNWAYLSDGDSTTSEDSFNNENKLIDFWGYTFSRNYRINRIDYTAGKAYPDGGWFSARNGGLRVQARRAGVWVDLPDFTVSPDYPYDNTAAATTFTLRFAPVATDGVRIIGMPGGTAFFTSIAELAVYLER